MSLQRIPRHRPRPRVSGPRCSHTLYVITGTSVHQATPYKYTSLYIYIVCILYTHTRFGLVVVLEPYIGELGVAHQTRGYMGHAQRGAHEVVSGLYACVYVIVCIVYTTVCVYCEGAYSHTDSVNPRMAYLEAMYTIYNKQNIHMYV